MGAASGRQLREASEKAQEPSGGGRRDCKAPAVGFIPRWLEGDEGRKPADTNRDCRGVCSRD